MAQKQQLYVALADQLAPLWKQDEELMEHDPATWQLVREIDDWLGLHLENEKVGVEQFARNCDRLRSIYLPATERITA